MSYRKITVDGVNYQYIIGKYYVKIRGLGAWPKQDIGVVVDQDINDHGAETIEVYPSHIKQKIQEVVS